MATDYSKHPLMLFEKARKLIGHKALIPGTHHRTMARQFDGGGAPSLTLMSYASMVRIERTDLIEQGEASELALTMPVIDIGNIRIETDVCCPECKVGIALIEAEQAVIGKPTWIFQTALTSCGCFEDLDEDEAEKLQLLHEKLYEMGGDQE